MLKIGQKPAGFLMLRKDLILMALAVAVLVFSLVRLTNKTAAELTVTAPVLVFVHSWESKEEMILSLIDEYNVQYPETEIIAVYKTYSEIKEMLFSSIETNSIEGDIIAIDPLWISELVKEEKIEPDEFPILRFFYPLFYNIELLKQAGFSGPPKTRSEFLTQARAVNQPDANIYAIAFALEDAGGKNPFRDLYSWIWAAGIALPTSTQISALRETLEFFVTLYNEVPGTVFMDENEKREAFLNGRTAFMIGSAEDMELLKSGLGDALDYTAIPVPDNYQGRPIFDSSGWNLAINRNSALKEDSRRFIDFLAEHSPLLAHGWAIPENNNPMFSPDPFYSKAQELYISGNLIRDYSGPQAGPVAFDFSEELMNLFEGRISAAEAAQRLPWF
ncbi:MAG: extracellular solute-binding protein [Treponema sp.]|jgi:multiple sugar transport system substrate-binding protein|nr:extracellular solute-binding protein [Treponema sp.]